MKIWVNKTTGNLTKREEILHYIQPHARVCQSKKEFESLENEPLNMKLMETLVNGGEHTPFEFFKIDFGFKDFPKMLFMLLNNEKQYSTCEKSARSTVMVSEGPGNDKYGKWVAKLIPLIEKEYPAMKDAEKRSKTVERIAMDSARYMTSVFTPSQMYHSLNLRQLNYLIDFFEEEIPEYLDSGRFKRRLADGMKEFVSQMKSQYPDFIIDGLKSKTDRHLTLFSDRKFKEQFGDSYTINYSASLTSIAQIQRSRSINLVITSNPERGHYNAIPKILHGRTDLMDEWLSDMTQISEQDYPQGMIADVTERGTIEDFRSKLLLRLCGHAHHETMTVTKDIAYKYSKNVPEVAGWIKTPCAQGYSCNSPCVWGSKSLERIV